MDRLDLSADGIVHEYLPDFLLESEEQTCENDLNEVYRLESKSGIVKDRPVTIRFKCKGIE